MLLQQCYKGNLNFLKVRLKKELGSKLNNHLPCQESRNRRQKQTQDIMTIRKKWVEIKEIEKEEEWMSKTSFKLFKNASNVDQDRKIKTLT